MIKGIFEQRRELMARSSLDDIIQQFWHQLRPPVRKKFDLILKDWENMIYLITSRILRN